MDDRSDLTTTASGLVVPARGISRRRVVGTAAWAAPAIVVAGAVPAFAASAPPAFTVTNLGSYRGASPSDTTATNNSGSFAYFNLRIAVPLGSATLINLAVTFTPASGSNGLNFSPNDSNLGSFSKASPSANTTNNATPFVFTTGTPLTPDSSTDIRIVFSNNSYASADNPGSLVVSASNTTTTVGFTSYSGNAAGFAVTGVYDILNPPHATTP